MIEKTDKIENNKATTKFDKYQQYAIDAVKNSVVSAGAGSGKTTVLSKRFSELIKNRNLHVDEILTLTFTKKATVEMSSRIYKVLKSECPEEAANFYKANIKTLDSYCASVAKQGCHFYGISPDFIQDDEKIRNYAKQLAIPMLLSKRENVALKSLLKVDKYDTLADDLFINPVLNNSTVVTPLDFEKMAETQKRESVEKWNEYFKESEKVILEMRDIVGSYTCKGKEPKTANTIRENIKAFDDFDKDMANISTDYFDMPEEAQTEFRANLKTQADFVRCASKTKKPRNMKGMEGLSEAIKKMEDLYSQISKILNYFENYKIVLEAFKLVDEFQKEINSFKRKSGILTFADIAQIALLTLKEHPEIRQVEKEKYKAIMIDEFQDNNKTQRDMLFMLAEKLDRKETGVPEAKDLIEDKLFFVGDEKQSIYRFRGADVSVFRELSNDFPEGNLSMSTNYRSDPALIAAFNTIFGGFQYPPKEDSDEELSNDSMTANSIPSVFPNEKEAQTRKVKNFEAIYHKVLVPQSKLDKIAGQSVEEAYKSHVHFALHHEAKEDNDDIISDDEIEAEWLARKIEEIHANGVDGLKEVNYNDIAILVKSQTILPAYERALLQHGIPYSSEKIKDFFDEGLINDIYSFIRICVYKNDKKSYASVLHGPIVNLSLSKITQILKTDSAPFECDVSSLLNEKEKKQYENGREKYLKILEDSSKLSLTQIISEIWYEFGYQYETMWNKNVEMFSKMYDILFESARLAEEKNTSLAAFSDYLKTLRTNPKKDSSSSFDINVPVEQNEGVHIMSIHKSKGLEFPVVFVANTETGKNNQESTKRVQYTNKYGLSFKGFSDIFYQLSKEENDELECAELKRLTYVALTRAENTVFISTGKYKPTTKTTNPDSIFKVLAENFRYFGGDSQEENTDMALRYFDEETIPDYQRSELSENSRKNTMEEKQALKEKLAQNEDLKKARVIQRDVIPERYIKPSHLDDEKNEDEKPKSYSTDVPYLEINKIVESTRPKNHDENEKAKPRFDYSDFGTIAHAYMEGVVKNEEPVILQKNIAEISGTEKLNKVLEICSEMAEKFRQSELGKEAINSEWHKCEYDFIWRLPSKDGNDKIMNGSIDLVFKNSQGKYTIVDYKTDSQINPNEHYVQLNCYRKVFSELIGCDEKDINCVLYYLRYGKAVDITDNLGFDISLKQ